MISNISEIKPVVEKIAKTNGLNLVLLFGSRARGKVHKKSDFDFGVMGQKRFSSRELAELSFLFSESLGIKIDDVEILDLKSAPPLLLRGIAIDSILLYENEPSLFSRFKIYSLKCYLEAKPLLDLRRRSLNNFLKNS